MITRLNTGLFFRNIWIGMLGIVFEICAVILLVLAGLVVCLVWWSFFR